MCPATRAPNVNPIAANPVGKVLLSSLPSLFLELDRHERVPCSNMVAFTYIAKRSGSDWKASRISSEEGPELSAEAADTHDLQKELKKISVENSDGGSVQTLLSTINKTTLIFQVFYTHSCILWKSQG